MKRWGLLHWSLMLVSIAGCQQKMADQPRYEPLEASRFFADGTSAQASVPGTIYRGSEWQRDDFHTGRTEADPAPAETVDVDTSIGEPADEKTAYVEQLPTSLRPAVLVRGRERFNIFCAPCHGHDGHGQGDVVRHGFPAAASLHQAEVRERPPGYVFDVITRGRGKMPSHAGRIPPADRWAIVAYVRALQLSYYAPLDELPPDVRQRAEEALAGSD